MFKKKAAQLGAAVLVLGLTFTACTDDNNPGPSLRSKTFGLTKSATDATSNGSVTLSENIDSSVNLRITITATTQGVMHHIYLIGGSISAPLTDTLLIDSISGTGNAVTKTLWNNIDSVKENGSSVKFNYDSAITNVPAFAKVVYSATKSDSVMAIGNILKSAQ